MYGTTTLAQIEDRAAEVARELGLELVVAQTNYEGEAIELLHAARGSAGVLMNPVRPSASQPSHAEQGAWAIYSARVRRL